MTWTAGRKDNFAEGDGSKTCLAAAVMLCDHDIGIRKERGVRGEFVRHSNVQTGEKKGGEGGYGIWRSLIL
jgi:hypothetical protein